MSHVSPIPTFGIFLQYKIVYLWSVVLARCSSLRMVALCGALLDHLDHFIIVARAGCSVHWEMLHVMPCSHACALHSKGRFFTRPGAGYANLYACCSLFKRLYGEKGQQSNIAHVVFSRWCSAAVHPVCKPMAQALII